MRIARKTLARAYRRFAPLALAFVYAFDALERRLVAPPGHDESNILIVKPDGIGDFVMGLPMLHRLRQLYPKGRYRLTLLANKAWSELAREQGIVDDVWAVDLRRLKRNIFYRWGIMKRIRRGGFGIAFNPIHSRAYHEDVAVAASGAPERIGCAGDGCNIVEWLKQRTDTWYTRRLGNSGPQPMELVRQAAILRELGASDAAATLPQLVLPSGPPTAVLAQLPTGTPYYVLIPGAGMSWKCWPAERLAAVAQRIFAKTQWTGVICGGPSEARACAALVAAVPAGVPLRNAAGRTPLADLARLISGALLVVGNDTGALHIAAAVGTPAVCTLGGGHFGHFFPYVIEGDDSRSLPLPVFHRMDCYGCNWECIYPVKPGEAFPCIQGITVDAVMVEVERAIGKEFGVRSSEFRVEEDSTSTG